MKKILIFIILKFLICNKTINNNKFALNIEKISNDDDALKVPLNNFSSNKKNVLLGLIVKYNWETILPFIKSLIKSKFDNCDIVMFVSEVTFDVIENLQSFGIMVYKIKEKLKDSSQIFMERWNIYKNYLSINKEKYKLVLSVDIRDTIVQKQFFEMYENYSNFIGFSYENATLDKLINKDRIINKFGIELFNTIKDHKTINAGTIWGTTDKFIEFSKNIYENLQIYDGLVDQALLNYLIYYNKILENCTVIFSDENGQVLTLGLAKRYYIKLDNKNNIINNKGQIVSIVHQYNRFKDIKKIILDKICPELTYRKINLIFIIYSLLLILLLILKIQFILYKYSLIKHNKEQK